MKKKVSIRDHLKLDWTKGQPKKDTKKPVETPVQDQKLGDVSQEELLGLSLPSQESILKAMEDLS